MWSASLVFIVQAYKVQIMCSNPVELLLQLTLEDKSSTDSILRNRPRANCTVTWSMSIETSTSRGLVPSILAYCAKLAR
jgi:hypothetical protein